MNADLVSKALRKIVAAVEGMGHKAAAAGAIAQQSWGAAREAEGVEVLISSGEAQRDAVLGAARGEGLQQFPGGTPLNLQYTDPKLGGTVRVDLVEAATPSQKQMLGRAQRGPVLQVQMLVVSCEDLILLLAGSTDPADGKILVELFRKNAARIDAPYLKGAAEAAGVLPQVKTAWQAARQA